MKLASRLLKGDQFIKSGVTVTVLRDAETGTETVAPLTGRPCVKVFCRREDTGAEGYVTFGQHASVQNIYKGE